ncbi:zinc metalloprotease [Nonomuraea sp. ATR24]|uniref:zinc metalloprotease n=1 Tax=Nonomuraea TaxID=83681 RepID=UPI001C5D3C7C|nr:zinc metalloprotease [Nonomuraea ceibae]
MTRRAAVLIVCVLAAGFTPPASPAAASSCLRAAGHPRSPEPRAPKPGDVAAVTAELAQRLRGVRTPARITVPTWVHVITDGAAKATTKAVKAQIATLNDAYAGRLGGADTGVSFRLDGIAVTRDAAWFTAPIAHERAMKTSLRKGGPETLNLYLAQPGDLVLGFSSYPYWYESQPRLDGVVIDWRGLPGGTLDGYDQGYTGVHEIGHWLGLFHTFENGCEEPGDGVADTPAQAGPTEGCPVEQDTCAAPGLDGVHNFMDYAQDRCMREFTAGQGLRMRQMWAAYRVRPTMSG